MLELIFTLIVVALFLAVCSLLLIGLKRFLNK